MAAVRTGSAWLRSRAYIYCSPEENCKSEQLLCSVQTDGWTDGRTNKGFFTKSVGRDREPTVLQQVLQSIPLVKSPLFSTSKTSQDATTSCKADAREAITSSCDKMSRDAVRDRTVEQYDYRRTMALRTNTQTRHGVRAASKTEARRMAFSPTGRLLMALAA